LSADPSLTDPRQSTDFRLVESARIEIRELLDWAVGTGIEDEQVVAFLSLFVFLDA
jgi:hypothetical protein